MSNSQRHPSFALIGGSGEAVADIETAGAPSDRDAWFRCRIPAKMLKALMRRSDARAWRNFGPWLALTIGSGTLAFLAWGTVWAIPAFLVFGTIWSSSDARLHETGHGTVFRTRWLNQVFYHLCCFMTFTRPMPGAGSMRRTTAIRWRSAATPRSR